MFIANNTVCMTENGIVLANTDFNKMYIMNNFIDINKTPDTQPASFVKSNLFPTLTVGRDTKVLSGRIERQNNKLSLKTKYIPASSLQNGDYIYIPKMHYDIGCDFTKTMAWLYAKYIVSGYYCLEQQTNIPTIIINPKRFSKKEAAKLKMYPKVSYDLKNKCIFIQNEQIIKQLGTVKKRLNLKLYGLNDNIVKYFIHSILIESPNEDLKFQYKTMAYDVFCFLHSRGNIIYKISEVKVNGKKIYHLSAASENDYILLNDHLYAKINKVIEGKSIKGVNIENQEDCVFYISLAILK